MRRKRMKIAVVDDMKMYRNRARDYIMQYYNKDAGVQIDCFQSGEDYLTSETIYDISFIDIEMSGMDGFETIKKARSKYPEGVYMILTTHTEMCDKGYLVNAYRYINKEKMEEMIYEGLSSAEILLGRNEKIKLNIIGQGIREIVLKDIIYVESVNHSIVIHTKHGDRRCSSSMRELEQELCDKWFFRCHKSFIVNLDEVESFKNLIAYMRDGSNVDIAQRKLWEFRRVYLKRIYDCGNA